MLHASSLGTKASQKKEKQNQGPLSARRLVPRQEWYESLGIQNGKTGKEKVSIVVRAALLSL